VPVDDRALMDVRADTLFIHDVRGRMVSVNDPDRGAVPRVFVGCTIDGYVIRCGATLPDAVALRLARFVEDLPPLEELRVAHEIGREVRAALAAGGPVAWEGGGPNYRFPSSIARSADVVQVTRENAAVVRDTFSWLEEELADWWPCFAVVRDGAAVSVCFSSRIGAAAAEAGVETLPDFRGHGFAAAVTAAWGAAVRAESRIPLYSTAWENLASQAVARRAGLIQFGADATWT
jgi:RimJ/RimL family protein N-acetyltransferase